MKLIFRVIRVLGLRRLAVFGVGVAAGLLAAPVPGAELRESLRRRLEELTGGTDDVALAVAVREELAQSPRTWHLPQPEVTVTGGRVVLSGVVPHPVAKNDVERTVSAVPGVVDVDNQLVVDTP